MIVFVHFSQDTYFVGINVFAMNFGPRVESVGKLVTESPITWP